MDKKWFDFVLVQQGTGIYLFRAPAFSKLQQGDTVLCDTSFGTEYGQVSAVVTLSEDDEDKIDFIMRATRANKTVRKVLSKVTHRYFEYTD